MASGRMEFHAQSIMQHANFAYVLPNDVEMAEVRDPRHYDRPTKSLILLHGLTGTDTDWLFGGVAQEMAIQYNLAVFMPTAGNFFYLDRGYRGGNWGTFVGEEFPDYVQKVFGFCAKREDTFIGGLSMGGFGAMRNGLKYAETFGRIVCLSGALHILDPDCDNLANEQLVFGDVDAARQTDANPEVCLKQLQDRIAAGEKLSIPTTYIACGMDDGLLGVNRKYRDLLTAAGADVTYEEEPGFAHEWDFWDRQIEKVVKGWLPLEDAQGGVNSGNVRGEN